MSLYWAVISRYSDGDRVVEWCSETRAEAEVAAERVRKHRDDQDEMPEILIEEYESGDDSITEFRLALMAFADVDTAIELPEAPEDFGKRWHELLDEDE